MNESNAVAERVVVPDGDPCPKHGLPTRLVYGQGIGLISQCQGCIDAFLDWFYQHTRHIRPVDRPSPAANTNSGKISNSVVVAPAQLELLR